MAYVLLTASLYLLRDRTLIIRRNESRNGYEFKLRKPKFLSRMHEFITQDGVHWEWKGDGIMTMDFTVSLALSSAQGHR